jgi:O-antigen/teichoic acid export membrane protein
MAARHWRYGRWVLVSAVLTPFLSQWQLAITTEHLGLASAGVYRAITTTTVPITQGITAISLLLLPKLAKLNYHHGPRKAAKTAAKVCCGTLLAAVAYEGSLLMWHSKLRTLLYANKVQFDSRLIAIAGIAAVSVAAGSCGGQLVKAMNRPGYMLFAEGAAATLTVPLTIILTVHFGLAGAIWSTVAVQTLWAFALLSTASFLAYSPRNAGNC